MHQCARRGCTRGRQPSCGGSRQHRCVPAFFAGARRASGVGGTIPAPACPLGETGKGDQVPRCRRPIPAKGAQFPGGLTIFDCCSRYTRQAAFPFTRNVVIQRLWPGDGLNRLPVRGALWISVLGSAEPSQPCSPTNSVSILATMEPSNRCSIRTRLPRRPARIACAGICHFAPCHCTV